MNNINCSTFNQFNSNQKAAGNITSQKQKSENSNKVIYVLGGLTGAGIGTTLAYGAIKSNPNHKILKSLVYPIIGAGFVLSALVQGAITDKAVAKNGVDKYTKNMILFPNHPGDVTKIYRDIVDNDKTKEQIKKDNEFANKIAKPMGVVGILAGAIKTFKPNSKIPAINIGYKSKILNIVSNTVCNGVLAYFVTHSIIYYPKTFIDKHTKLKNNQ